MSSKSRTSGNARRWCSPCTPAPTIASERTPGRASTSQATAAAALVRIAVMYVPSMNARQAPVSLS